MIVRLRGASARQVPPSRGFGATSSAFAGLRRDKFRLRGASARQVPPSRGFGATSSAFAGLRRDKFRLRGASARQVVENVRNRVRDWLRQSRCQAALALRKSCECGGKNCVVAEGQNIGCAAAFSGYRPRVDWQQLVSLLIVAGAAVWLLAGKFRRRRFSFERD